MIHITELVNRLDAYARAQGVLALQAYCVRHYGEVEIDGVGQFITEADTFCGNCANAAALSVETTSCPVDLFQGEDSCCHCVGCGVLLNYALNEVGVSSELTELAAAKISGPVHGEYAFHLARVIESAKDDELADACMMGLIAISTFVVPVVGGES